MKPGRAANFSGSESGLCQGREASPPTPDYPAASASQREVLSCEPLSRTERCW